MSSHREETKVREIAIVCHEANRAVYEVMRIGDIKPWDELEDWERKNAMVSVRWCIDSDDGSLLRHTDSPVTEAIYRAIVKAMWMGGEDDSDA